MSDFSSLSDDDLVKLYQGGAAPPSAPTQITVRPQDANPLASMSNDELMAAYHGTPSAMGDIAKSAGVGLAKGGIGLAGLLGDATDLGARGIDAATRFVMNKAGLPAPAPNSPERGTYIPGAADIQKTVEGYTGEFYKPQTTAGKYAQTVGEFAPSIAMGPGGLARKAIGAVGAGLGSEAAGQLANGGPAEPYARVAGAIAGGMAPSALQRVVTPFPATAQRNAAVDTLRQEGVTDLTAGQTTGRKGLQYFESEMGGSRGATMQDRQAEQFTQAVLRRAGENAPRATPEVIHNAFGRIGQQFDDLAARNNVRLDRPLANELVNIERDYNRLVSPSARAPIVADTIRDIGHVAAQTGGVMDGAAYQALRSRLDRAARASARDPQLAEALRDLRGAVDDAMNRSLVNPADRLAYRTARREYRNMLVIEKAATAAGENAAQGLISPSALRNATVTSQGRRNYARGQGDFADLARAGESVMKPLPNSGTAPRMAAQRLGMSLSGIGGAILGGQFGGMEAGLGAAVGGLLPHMAGRAAMTRPVQGYLGNQLLAGGQAPPMLPSALLQSLMTRPELLPRP